jgi:PPOX class probable F420-dependent enzyme
MADAATPLDQERYISLETFRRDGSGVKTPVWAAALDGRLVIVTDGTSYKVKRLRNNPKCRAAASDARGKVKGPWFDGQCRILDDAGQIARAHAALRDKYGWQMWLLDTFSRLGRRIGRRAFLEVALSPSP